MVVDIPRLSDLGEREAVARLIQLFDPDGVRRLGDDCAVLDLGKEFLLTTTDMICRKTHLPEGARPVDMGWYAAAINLSDIAAMGGRPLGMLFALGLPGQTSWDEVEGISTGIRNCCSEFGIPVLGGDTKENESLTISGTAIGTVPKGEIMWRKGARPGDIIAMTGRLGRPLQWSRDGSPEGVSALLRLEPRIREGQQLASSRAVTSCIDISDGLSTSLHHLSDASQVGLEIDFDSLPMTEGLSVKEKELAIHYGGDFELLFTVDPGRAEKVFSADPGSVPMTRIGVVTEETSVRMTVDGGSQPLPDRGYEHFRGAKE